MAENPESQAASPSADAIPLKDPLVAGFLAWLVPGLGHFYQGRYAKGALLSVCILGTFLYGLRLGSTEKIGWGRVVFVSFRTNEVRWMYLGQLGVGLPALPAVVQWLRVESKRDPLPYTHALMAPPAEFGGNGPNHRSLSDLHKALKQFFEIGTAYTFIAGLLNILAIYDACCGPVPEEVEKSEKSKAKRDEEPGDAS